MIDINKKYKTRDGREVIIHAVDGPNPNKLIVGSVKSHAGPWGVRCWSIDGLWDCCKSPADLIEVTPPWHGEIWVHPDGTITRTFAAAHDGEWIDARWRKISAIEKEPT